MAKPQSSFDPETALDQYLEFMREIKLRVDFCVLIFQGKVKLVRLLGEEILFLQLRMICELLAMSCLVAHGDIVSPQRSKLQKSWSASEIMTALKRLNPEFYPVPQNTVSLDHRQFYIVDCEIPYLTREEFLKLYDRICNSALHKGSLAKFIKLGDKKIDPEVPGKYLKLIINLLRRHKIVSLDKQFIYFINTTLGEEAGQVKGYLLSLPEGQSAAPNGETRLVINEPEDM